VEKPKPAENVTGGTIQAKVPSSLDEPATVIFRRSGWRAWFDPAAGTV